MISSCARITIVVGLIAAATHLAAAQTQYELNPGQNW